MSILYGFLLSSVVILYLLFDPAYVCSCNFSAILLSVIHLYAAGTATDNVMTMEDLSLELILKASSDSK